MYMLVAIAVTILVIALAWRGIGARTPGADSIVRPRCDQAATSGASHPHPRTRRRSRVPQRDQPEAARRRQERLTGYS